MRIVGAQVMVMVHKNANLHNALNFTFGPILVVVKRVLHLPRHPGTTQNIGNYKHLKKNPPNQFTGFIAWLCFLIAPFLFSVRIYEYFFHIFGVGCRFVPIIVLFSHLTGPSQYSEYGMVGATPVLAILSRAPRCAHHCIICFTFRRGGSRDF